MSEAIEPNAFTVVGEVEQRYQSYNVEMAEVTGGTFWKPFTEAQRSGEEKILDDDFDPQNMSGFANMGDLMAPRAAVDLSGARIRTLAKALGPAYIRVSGSWASHTYFDIDGIGHHPEGYDANLTTEQWDGVIDFAKAVDAELVTSMANTEGAHDETGAWNPDNSRRWLQYTREHGLRIAAAEFMNEPDVAGMLGAPKGYSAADYGRDVRIFTNMLREVSPDTKFIGPGSAIGGDVSMFAIPIPHTPTRDLMAEAATVPDIFSYHHYYGLSERGKGLGHQPADRVLTEEYLALTERTLNSYVPIHDEFAPGTPYWNTETGDAAMGGNSWSPTWLDCPRYIDQLGRLARRNVTAVMHNTLCASDYALLDDVTHAPRAKYWAALLWAKIMGTTVYETGIPLREGLHLYAHSRRDGLSGFALVAINTSRDADTVVSLPSVADVYQLTGAALRGQTVLCNGAVLEMVDDKTLPEIAPRRAEAGDLVLPPVSITFITI